MLKLPIDVKIPEILEALQSHSALVLEASPGSGKTTRVPPALMDFFKGGEVWVLEPRRIAAKLSALRVAEERGEPIGKSIGYQFRFERALSAQTRLLFLTEGMLLRRLMQNPDLRGVACVVLDEFHERHLHTDVAFAYLVHLQKTRRPDLKIVVMSATLETNRLEQALAPAAVVKVVSQNYPVDVVFKSAVDKKYGLPPAVLRVLEEAFENPIQSTRGDVLVFLPGMSQMRAVEKEWNASRASWKKDAELFLLHGDLTKEEQDRALAPSVAGRVKVILSTNIAETSVTLPGVTVVIDAGLHRRAQFSAWSGLSRLETRAISRASAVQRAGRAGRTAPGRCYRLYSKDEFQNSIPFETPEIQRADLVPLALELRALGVARVDDLPWLDVPAKSAIEAADALLVSLGALEGALKGAIDADLKLTDLGRKMAEIPLHPRLSRVVLEAQKRGVLASAIDAVAWLSEGDLERGDFLEKVEKSGVLGFGVRKQRERLRNYFEAELKVIQYKLDKKLVESALKKSLLAGFPDRIAQVRWPGNASAPELLFSQGGASGGRWSARSLEDLAVFFEDASALQRASQSKAALYLLVLEMGERKGLGDLQARASLELATQIEIDWLIEMEPSPLQEISEVKWNADQLRVDCVEQWRCGRIVVEEEVRAPRSVDELHAASQVVLEGMGIKAGLSDLEWIQVPRFKNDFEESGIASLVERAHYVAQETKEVMASDLFIMFFRRFLEETLKQGITRFKDFSVSEFQGWLRAQSEPLDFSVFANSIDRLAPENVLLPGGRRLKIQYDLQKGPWAESRIQDFFGMKEGPKILQGKVPVTLHLLAPNYRAFQVTQDLAGFWVRTYPEARRELARRYPRHPFPEDYTKPLPPRPQKKS